MNDVSKNMGPVIKHAYCQLYRESPGKVIWIKPKTGNNYKDKKVDI